MRVRLEPLDDRHTDDVVRWRADERVSARLFSERGPTREEHERWLSSLATRRDREEFAIIEEITDRPVGTIGLSAIDFDRGAAEYGILIDPDAQGRGFAREASHLILRHAFDALGLREVILELFADNESALRLYEKLGFTIERRSSRLKLGVERPTLIMRLTADTYRLSLEKAAR